MLKHLQRPQVQECLDRGSPYWFFRYREDQQLPDGGVKTTRKRHILAPSQGRYALSRRQAETARDRFLAGLQAPPVALAASMASVSSNIAPATDLSFGQLAAAKILMNYALHLRQAPSLDRPATVGNRSATIQSSALLSLSSRSDGGGHEPLRSG